MSIEIEPKYWEGKKIWRYKLFESNRDLIYFFTSTKIKPDQAIDIMKAKTNGRRASLECNGVVIKKYNYSDELLIKDRQIVESKTGHVYNNLDEFIKKKKLKSASTAYRKIKRNKIYSYVA